MKTKREYRRGLRARVKSLGTAAISLVSLAVTALAATDELPALNEPANTPRVPGRIIWADLFTSDADVAARFYAELFGWSASRVGANGHVYTVLMNGDRPVAGIVARPHPGAAGTGARWIGYVSVGVVDDVVARATAADGKVLAPARAFPRRGTQAIFADPQGAVLGVLSSSTGDGGDFEPVEGEWAWLQLLVREPAAAAVFYRRVCEYEVSFDPAAASKQRYVLSSGGFARAGIAPLPVDEPARAGWVPFVRVANIERTTAAAVNAGGRSLVAGREATAGTRFAVIGDPVGAVLGIVEIASESISRR